MQDLLVLMITLRDYYHTAHVCVKNSVSYSDHLLLERLYDGVSDYIDPIKEKIKLSSLISNQSILPTLRWAGFKLTE